MTTLHIEHVVFDFETWKRTFDGFADRREKGGVTGYRVSRPYEDGKLAVIDLEFAERAQAEAFLAMLRELWTRVEGKVIEKPRAVILETVERR